MRKMILSSLAVFLGVSVLLGGIRTSVDAWHHRTIRCNGFVVVPVSLPVLADRLILDRKDNHEWGKALCDLDSGVKFRDAWMVIPREEEKTTREWYEVEGKVESAFFNQNDAVGFAESLGRDEISKISCIDYHRCGDYTFQYDGCRVIKRADVVVGYWKFLPKTLTKPDHDYDWKVRPVDMNGNEFHWVEDYYRIPPKTPFRWKFAWTDNGKACLDPRLTKMRMETSSPAVEKVGEAFVGKPGTVAHFCGCTSVLVDFGGQRPVQTIRYWPNKWGCPWLVSHRGMGAYVFKEKKDAEAAVQAEILAYEQGLDLLSNYDYKEAKTSTGCKMVAGNLVAMRVGGESDRRLYRSGKLIGRAALFVGPFLRANDPKFMK